MHIFNSQIMSNGKMVNDTRNLFLILCVLPLFRKSSRLQREEKASSGKQQAGKVCYSVIPLQRTLTLSNYRARKAC